MTDNWPKGSEARTAARADIALEVRYRSTGSFLVSYSLNLSKGGLFIETDDLLPVNTRVTVQFEIPGASAPVRSEATVIWARSRASAEGPRGMGLAFDALDAQIGDRIDQIVSSFSGVSVLCVAFDAAACLRLSRQLNSVLSCAVSSAYDAPNALARVTHDIDLVLVDLDSLGDVGVEVVAGVIGQAGPPLLVLSSDEQLRDHAVTVGATTILDNPAPFAAFRETLLSLLARPARPAPEGQR